MNSTSTSDYPEIEFDWEGCEPPDLEFECQTCGKCCVSPGNVRVLVRLYCEDVERMPLHVLQAVTEPEVDGLDLLRVMKMVKRPDGLGCIAFRGRVGKKCGCAIYEWRPHNCRYFEAGAHCVQFLDMRAELEEE